MDSSVMKASESIMAFEAGAAEERARIKRIMDLPASHGRESVALTLALQGDILVDAIVAILETFPASSQPTFNLRPIRIPRHMRLAFCTSTENTKKENQS